MPEFAMQRTDDVGFDVIGLGGQSNMRGTNVDLDSTYLDSADGRVQQWANLSSTVYSGKVVSAVDPLFHRDFGSLSVGHAAAFGRLLSRRLPTNRRILLVPCSSSGTGFTTSSNPSPPSGYRYYSGSNAGTWDPTPTDGGVSLYEAMIASITAALASGPNNRYVGSMWLQGEADAGSLTQAQYAAKLDTLIAGLRSRVSGAATSWFLLGQMLPERIVSAPSTYGLIHAAHVDTARRNTGVGFFYGTLGHTYLGDGLAVHYDGPGQRQLAKDAFYTALPIAKANVVGVAPLVPAAPTLTQSGTSVAATWAQLIGRITDFNVRYSTNGGTSWTALTRTTPNIDVNATIAGLTLGGTVLVQVQSVNEQGTSAWSPSASLTLAQLPNAVTGFSASSPTSSAVPLPWTASAVDGTHSAATGYLVEYTTHGGSTWTAFGTATTAGATVSGLATQTQYDFRVTPLNAAGSGPMSSLVTATTLAAQTLSVDVGVTPDAAWGLRRLVNGYSGNLVMLRRSSDNATSSFGCATGTNDLDTAAVLAWAGSASAYIVTVFDQSGNGRDITQATTTAQPRLVNAGVLDTMNSKAGGLYSGAQYLANSSPILYAAGAGTVLALCKLTTANTCGIYTEGSASGSSALYSVYASGTSGALSESVKDDGGTQFGFAGGGTALTNGAAASQVSALDSGTAVTTFINAAQAATTSYTRSGHTLTLAKTIIGAFQLAGTVSNQLTGQLPEVVIWKAALTTAQRQAGEANQKAYYATP